jgi:hypothetical protein
MLVSWFLPEVEIAALSEQVSEVTTSSTYVLIIEHYRTLIMLMEQSRCFIRKQHN